MATFTAEKLCFPPHLLLAAVSECIPKNGAADLLSLHITSALSLSSSIVDSVLFLSLAERSITAVSLISLPLFFHLICAALKSPAAFHEQRRSLERARVSVLKRVALLKTVWSKTLHTSQYA